MMGQSAGRVVMDYPAAWAYVREQHPDPSEHDPRCSWVIANRAVLCDCHVLWDEYERRDLMSRGRS